MSSSIKIFRPWDRQEALDREQKPQDTFKGEKEFTEVPALSNELKLNQYCDQTNTLINQQLEADYDKRANKSGNFLNSRTSFHLSEPHLVSENSDLNKPQRNVNARDQQRDYLVPNDSKKTCANIKCSDEHLENKIYGRSRSLNGLSEPKSSHGESCDNSRLHKKHSRRHSSRQSKEEIRHVTRSTSSSPRNPILDTSLQLSQDSNKISEFSNFENHFYPDFRSLEFLPEDILDPILMSGLSLGAPLDPYWSNLALEYYKSHEQTMRAKHQRPKKFNCPHCNVAFSNNGQLKGHIRIHTGERPFKCDAESCGKSFTRNEELTRHKRIHSGLRPYPCTHCGKKFGRKDHLKKHLRTHFPQPRYVPVYPYMYAGGYATVIM